MADKFDPYREALVMETETLWPEAYEDWDHLKKEKISAAAHADAENIPNLVYVRTHSGFCRQITLTEDDIARLRGK